MKVGNTWKKFTVGLPSERANWEEKDCHPFSEIFHITHIESALSIFNLKKIQAGLIFDKSKLNNDRILVNWLSPNYWADGFRYGNIRFTYDFNKLVLGKNYYWVEEIAYGISACRILISSKVYAPKDMLAYDPTKRDGPWYYDNKKNIHYFNGNFTLEIMIEQDASLEEALRIDFVDHHNLMCNIDHKKCSELGFHQNTAGAFFLSRLISRGIDIFIDLEMYKKTKGYEVAFHSWIGAVRELSEEISRLGNPSGTIKYGTKESLEFAKLIIISFAYNQNNSRSLINLFASTVDLKNSVRDACAIYLGFTNYVSLIDD